MATKKTSTEVSETTEATETTATATTAATATKTAKATQTEATYTADEFAAVAASLFGSKPDIVKAAFRVAGVTSATKSEAIEIVNKFRKREVK
ncbi:MAG: hypothetical protein LUE24_02995 [Lachnospiraceae bacterium]|nr:hypothetical protein [Lachnospiraceae bacterium]MCD8196126.1 hypothetical protein [Lachnospiraceae bacterium]